MNKISFLIAVLIFLCCSFISCSGHPGDVLLQIEKQHSEGIYDNLNEFYTAGTVKQLNELDKLSSKNKSGKPKEDKRFAVGAKWDVLSEKISGDTADLTIKYTSHPAENMIGLELTFKMMKEGDRWKIDMEDELKRVIELIRKTEQTSVTNRRSGR